MRRTTSIVARLSISILAPAVITAGTIALPPIAHADDPGSTSASDPSASSSSRGSIHEEASRQAAADYRRKAQNERTSLEEGDRIREQVVRRALAQVGDNYGAGGEGPNVFDCSGLVIYAWRPFGVDLEHYSRAQYEATERISLKDARPGDLAFYFENGAHHVAIYIGDGKVVHASDYGIGVVKGVVKGTPWTNEHFTGMGRVTLPG